MSLKQVHRVFVVLIMAAGLHPCYGEQQQDVDTITVESSVLMESTARVELDRSDIARASAVSIGDLLAQVPNLKVQMNSRGEQVFAVRGSDQRQVALTLDGAPLVSAWDGQLDLSLLPTSAIQRIAVTRGPASVLQGPNALAGAVNVISRRGGTPGWDRAVTVNAGPEWRGLEGFIGHSAGAHAFSAALGWNDTDGFEAGGEDDLVPGSDFKNHSAVLGWNFHYGSGATTGLTLLTVDNGKGVIPERTSSGPRYWRYPQQRKDMLVWYGRHPVGGGTVDYSLYLDRGKSRIDQYADSSYSLLSNIEDGIDRAGGGRIQWTQPLTNNQDLSFGVNWTRSKHLFRERATSQSYAPFSQVLSQLAAEWRGTYGPWTMLLGSAYEHFKNPHTGPFANPGSRDDWAATGAVNYALTADITVDLTVGRKTRFPSLREAYNGALGRFVLNPELGPETAVSGALGVVGAHDRWEWEARAFATDLSDGIVRVGLPNRRFTRINQASSRILGVELGTGLQLTQWLHGHIEGTLLRTRAQSPAGSYDQYLEYRPAVNLGAEFTVDLPAHWSAAIDARYLAKEHGLLEISPVPQELPSYLLWNIAAERTFNSRALGQFLVVIRLDNLADEYYQTQWGLPGAGRRWSIGFTWNK